MIYLTGDTHGDFTRVLDFCLRNKTSKDDVLIILGDAGINFNSKFLDNELKADLCQLPITLFCIYGNHEKRPENIPSYKQTERFGGTVYIETQFPDLLFAKDGEIYNFGEYKCIAIGGADSIDKQWRTLGKDWWDDEQPSAEIKARVEEKLSLVNWNVDVVLSHTCPFRYMPTEVFLKGFDQTLVDNSTEEWLGFIEEKLNYSKWYCGHFHTDKVIDKMEFLFEDFVELAG